MLNSKAIKFLAISAVAVAPFIVPLSASAETFEKTIVNGQVRDASNNNVVGANVSISCNSNNVSTTTDGVGKYYYEFDGVDCPLGSLVSVQAVSGSESGSGSANVQEIFNNGAVVINLALINITTAVPEFGLLMGLGTAISSAGAFLVMRRRSV